MFFLHSAQGWETDELFLFWLPCDTSPDTSSVWQNLHPAWKSAIRWLRCIHPHSFSIREIKPLICVNNSLPVEFKLSKKNKTGGTGSQLPDFSTAIPSLYMLWHWVTTRGRLRGVIQGLPLRRMDENTIPGLSWVLSCPLFHPNQVSVSTSLQFCCPNPPLMHSFPETFQCLGL